MDPFHRIGCGEWQRARKHLVEDHSERVEIAAQVDRPVHSSGLFGRHIGERPRNELRWTGGLTLARQARGETEAGQVHVAGCTVHQDVRGLKIFVYKVAPMHPTERCRDGDSEGQELSNLHRFAQTPVERLATWILEDQYRPIAVANQFQRPDCPRTLQMILQSVFMRETIDASRPLRLCGP